MSLSSSNNFLKSYEKQRSIVDKRLLKSVENRKPGSLYEPSYYILQGGGKRLRPILLLFSTDSIGGKFSDAYNAAVAVELLHNFTLVHDDIMDNAEKRRSRLTLHKKYNLSTAILSGDSLLSIAYEYLLKDCRNNCKEVLSAFTEGLVQVCEGQSLDKDFETTKDVSLNDYISMVGKKTAALSEMCCRIGALLGNGTKRQVEALASYGRNLGIAFQIQDDLLDVIGEESKFGKKIGSDIVEGKKTYLFIKAFMKAKGKDKDYLNGLIKNKGAKKYQVIKFKRIYENLGVLEDANEDVTKYSNKALNSIKILQKNKQEFFRHLAASLTKRSN